MSLQPYTRPPITEAVIEIRVGSAIEMVELGRVSADLADFYPLEQPVKSVDVAVGMPSTPEGKPTARVNEETGHRRSSSDLTEIVVLWSTKLSISQLSPYPGWDTFFGRFMRDWAIWKKRIGYRKVTRIGVRYINRLDIPISGSAVIEESEYLNVYPHLPKALGTMMAYGVQAVLPLAEIRSKLTLNSSAVPSPLLDHAAFIFDQDISREAELPQRDEDIYRLLREIRDMKNRLFEACVTDRARELFQK
jgi:uncharacterized protein (TIGR04255 family)